LDFPSVYLELVVIRALQLNFSVSLAERVLVVLRFLANSFVAARVTDPANANNAISDDLTFADKLAIERAAQVALAQETWGSIVQ
jgi:hypothetical protein